MKTSSLLGMRKPKITWSTVMIYLPMMVVSVTFLYPLIYTLLASLKDNQEIFLNPFGPPAAAAWGNYVRAWSQANMRTYFINSVYLTAVTTACHLLLGSMAGYVIGLWRTRMAGIANWFFLIGMMVPIQAILIPVTRMAVSWNASNSHWFLLCVYIAGGLPMTVFIIGNYMRSFPLELEEAAIIDGCKPWQFYWRILLPMSTPILVTMGIISFISTWNELIVALVLISSDQLKTLPLGLLNFTGAYSTDYAALSAAVMITIIPTLIVYLLMQDKVEKGLAEGAVKG